MKPSVRTCASYRPWIRLPSNPGHREGFRRPSLKRCCFAGAREELLAQLLELDDEALQRQVSADESPVNVPFLVWLAEKHDCSPDHERQKLHLLGGRIMCLKYGLKPGSAEEVSAAEKALLPAPTEGGQLAPNGNGGSLWQASRELLLLERAKHVEALIKASRDSALLEIAGRREMDAAELLQLQKGLAAVDISNRILDVLLAIPERDLRRANLVDAFTPPSDDADLAYGPEELLYTTPLQLLQAVRSMQASIREGGNQGAADAPIIGGLSRGEVLSRLDELFEDIMELWQP